MKTYCESQLRAMEGELESMLALNPKSHEQQAEIAFLEAEILKAKKYLLPKRSRSAGQPPR